MGKYSKSQLHRYSKILMRYTGGSTGTSKLIMKTSVQYQQLNTYINTRNIVGASLSKLIQEHFSGFSAGFCINEEKVI